MSKLKATDNFETGNWSLNIENLAPSYGDLLIGFTDNAPVVEFIDLKFGFELKKGTEILQSAEHPPFGLKYIESDQPYLVTERLQFQPNTTYTLFLWCENNGERFEKEFQFTTPKPIQPYPSWLWDGEKWYPPVPYPNDDNDYIWDEDIQNWAEIIEDE